MIMIQRNPGAFAARSRQSGITLLEMVVVLVILSTGVVSLLPLFRITGNSILENENIQTGAQLVRECSEHILVARRYAVTQFAGVDNTICDVLPAFGNFTRTVTVNIVTNADLPACPPTVSCKEVIVRVDRSGQKQAEDTIMLVDY
jgi:type II secretory pathway pseudopilin PulG